MAQVDPNGKVRTFQDPNDFKSIVTEYVRHKASIDLLEKRSKELREKIFNVLDTDGVEDTNGNIVLPLQAAIDGVVRLEKQRRVTRKIDEMVADQIISEKNLGDTVYEMKRVINEDALMAAYYNGDLTEDELDSMFPISVTWALRTAKK